MLASWWSSVSTHGLDRATYQGVRCYRAPITKVCFAFSGRDGSVQLFGNDAAPTTVFDAAPFGNYRRWLTMVVLIAAAVAGIGSVLYLARDRYYGATVGSFLLALAVFGVGTILYTAGWRRRAGPTKAKRGIVEIGSIGLATVGASAAGLLLGIVKPSLDEANSAIAAGNLAVAERHLGALDRAGHETDETWAAYYNAAAEAAESDEELLEVLPAPNERLGDHPELAERRRAAQLRLFEATVDGHDFGQASERLAELRAEHGGTRDDVDAHVKAHLVTAASALLELGHAAEAERALTVAWVDFSADPEYSAVGEHAILAQVPDAGSVEQKVATLRRAEGLKASDEPRRQLDVLYQTEKAKVDEVASAIEEQKDGLSALTRVTDDYRHIRVLFPEHAAEVEKVLGPLDEDRAQLLAKKRAAEKRDAATAERKRQAALKKEERRAKKQAATSRPVMRTCCKYCNKGIPCGDTCISASKTCHKGPGCAC